MTKRFLVFAYDDYYPAGGWKDLRGGFDTPEDAEKAAESLRLTNDHVQIVDTAEAVIPEFRAKRKRKRV